MNYKIVETDDRNDSKFKEFKPSSASPITYRVSIRIAGNANITLTREYFYYGYYDGERQDDFYFDFEWASTLAVGTGSFYTRNFDPEYLKEKEKELIELFYKKLIKSEKRLEIELDNQLKILGKRIEEYQEYQKNDLFIKIIRKEKLENLM